MASEAKRILLVEDEAIIALAERRLLENNGYIVSHASSGEKAVQLAAAETPDLILMDIDLGRGMDGTAAAQAILARREIPIVFLSSHSSRDMVEKVRAITRYGYVVKNSGNFILLSSIEMAFDLFEAYSMQRQKAETIRRAERMARFGSWRLSEDRTRFLLSEGAVEVCGLDSAELEADVFRNLIVPEDRQGRDEAFARALAEGRPYEAEYRLRRPADGLIVWVHSMGESDGSGVFVFGTLQDISQRRFMEDALRRAEEKSRITLKAIGDGVIATDNAGAVRDLNPAAEEMTGWHATEARGRPIQEVMPIIHAKTRVPLTNPVRWVLREGRTAGLDRHSVLVARDGTERNIADSAAPIRTDAGAITGVVLNFRDVTDEYANAERLKENEERYRSLFTDNKAPILLVDPSTGTIADANAAAAGYYGWSVPILKRMNISDINTLSEDAIAREMTLALAQKRNQFYFRHRRADGSVRDVSVMSNPVTMRGQALLYSLILDLSLPEADEFERTRRYRILGEHAGDLAWSVDACTGTFTYVSPGVSSLRGYSVEEALAQSLDQALTPESFEEAMDAWTTRYMDIAEGKSEAQKPRTAIYELTRKGGGSVPLEVSSTVIVDGHRRIKEIVGICRNVSDKLKAEKTLKDLAKAKSMLLQEMHRRTAAGLNFAVQLLDVGLEGDAEAALRTAKARLRTLKTLHDCLSGRQDSKTVNLREFLGQLTEGVKALHGAPSHALVESYVDDASVDSAHALPLGIIVQELLDNSLRHAFPDGREGSITLACCLAPSGALELRLSDDGVGLSEPHRSGVGLELVRALSSHLDGSFEYLAAAGANFRVVIPPLPRS